MKLSGVERSGEAAPALTPTPINARARSTRLVRDHQIVLLQHIHARTGDDHQVGLLAGGQPFLQRARRVTDIDERVARVAREGGTCLLDGRGHRSADKHLDFRLRERECGQQEQPNE